MTICYINLVLVRRILTTRSFRAITRIRMDPLEGKHGTESSVSGDGERIGLVDAVKAVRIELMEAVASADGESIQLDVDQIELAFSVELKRDSRVRGGVKAWIFSAEAESAESEGNAHMVKIVLSPKYRDSGNSVQVGDDDLGID